MKIFTVVGIRKSGKTTTVTELIREFRSRGLRVGTVKNVFCPGFTMDTQGSNTWRHREAGADFVMVKAKEEVDILYPGGDVESLIRQADCDVLILEGDYQISVPRIVCARKDTKEIDERRNVRTIAVSGRIAEQLTVYEDLPVFHCIRQVRQLADFILEQVPECSFPLEWEQIPEHTSSFCQCGCHKTEKKLKKDMGPAPLTAAPAHGGRHIFLTGEKQVGKSTLLKRLRSRLVEELGLREVGYETRTYDVAGEKKGYCMHSLVPLEPFENDCPVTIRIGEKKMLPLPQTFEKIGVKVLRESMASGDSARTLLVLDEIGKAEEKAPEFQQQLFRCLDHMEYALGILQKHGGAFAQAVANRPDVLVYEVTEENREQLLGEILNEISNFHRGWGLAD